MTFELLNSFPIPRVDEESGRVLGLGGTPLPAGANMRSVRDRLIHIAGRLGAIDGRFANWAKEVGVPVASVQTESAKADLVAELDALVGLAYGLGREQMEKVFATFHRGWDYSDRLKAVLSHYDTWTAQIPDGEDQR